LKGFLWDLVLPFLQKGCVFALLSEIVRKHVWDFIYYRIPAVAFGAGDYSGGDFIFLFEYKQFKRVEFVDWAS